MKSGLVIAYPIEFHHYQKTLFIPIEYATLSGLSATAITEP